jgi:hypothetical protein
MNEKIISIIRKFLPLAVGLSLVFFAIYVSVQQVVRMGANEPQIQLAEDTAVELANGKSPKFLRDNPDPVDIAKSLAPFMIVFDNNGKLTATNVQLNDTTPMPPAGVLTYAKIRGENRVTWQPEAGVRIAAVIVYYSANGREGYVLAGRSLREAEIRIDNLSRIAMFGWLVTLIFTLMVVAIVKWKDAI